MVYSSNTVVGGELNEISFLILKVATVSVWPCVMTDYFVFTLLVDIFGYLMIV